jgi:hypothetical protein
MPKDTAIPVKEVPPPSATPRPFKEDKKLLQREQKKGVSPVLTTIAYVSVLLIALIVAVLLILGLRKIRRSLGGDQTPPASGERRERRPARSAVPAT